MTNNSREIQPPTTTLLLVALGPIQDFIESARQCQDLWFGSYLLSALSRAAATAMETAGGERCLIFPASLGEEEKPAVANKILVRVPDGKSASDIAIAGRNAMNTTLGDLAKVAFDRVSKADSTRGYFHRNKAEEQLGDLMEFDWVSVPGDDYNKARGLAEQLLASRKNTRTWKAVGSWAGTVPKSSLDGLRESVLDEKLYDLDFPVIERRRGYHVKKAERLCGVGLLKRIGAEIDDEKFRNRPVFHSTSHVAAGPFRARMAASPAAQEAVREYLQALISAQVDLPRFRLRPEPDAPQSRVGFSWLADRHAGDEQEVQRVTPRGILGDEANGYDAYLFFEDRLPEILSEDTLDPGGEDSLHRLRGALSKVFKAVGATPTTYYALLLADGDNMGRALDIIGQSRGAAGHKALGTALDRFSFTCRHLVEQHAGSLIYAGGDDVLALVPLHTALACATALHDAFGSAMSSVEGLPDERPTLSIGLGIAHHMDDMAHARDLAKDAEKLAKAHPGKDALGIVLDKRSGATLKLVGSWKAPPGERSLRERIDTWCRLLRADGLSDKAAYDLEEAMTPLLVPAKGKTEPTPGGPPLNQVALSLATRVLLRKRPDRGRDTLAADVLKQLRERFTNAVDTVAAIRALSHELQTARAFLRAYECAFGEVKS